MAEAATGPQPRLWAAERERHILCVLQETGRVEADRLADSLGVSRETIRRDVIRLESRGALRRVHGGALLAESSSNESEAPFTQRMAVHIESKQVIAQALAPLIVPGSCCFIDAGSTTLIAAEVLTKIPDLTIFTNALTIGQMLKAAGAEVILLGGTLGPDTPATFGTLALEQLRRLHADYAILSPVGIEARSGVTYFSFEEAEIARTMIARAKQQILLADASKIGITSRVWVADCDQIDVLVTDVKDATALEAAGVRRVVGVGKGA